jgi:hypothetical protein
MPYLVAVVSAICAAAFLVLAARIANSMVDLLPDAPAGGNIAHFSTMEAADASIAYARRAFRTAFNTDWCVTGEGR